MDSVLSSKTRNLYICPKSVISVGERMVNDWKFYAAGSWMTSRESTLVHNVYTKKPYAKVFLASKAELEGVITKAQEAFQVTKNLPSHARAKVCLDIADGIEKQSEEFAQTIAIECGKPLIYARGEVARAISTFRVAAEEANRIGGEVLPLDITKVAEKRFGLTKRFPIGLIFGISPFNFPLNLVAHKIAPAIASGNVIILKPATKTPLSSLLLARIIDQTDLPKGAVSIVPCERSIADSLVADERFAMVSFTGSPHVGWDLKNRAGKKKVILELGGNAAVIVDQDCNLEKVVPACVTGSFAYSGQVCISIQRIAVHENVYDRFIEQFIQKAKSLKMGDPLKADTLFSVMIDEANAKRIESWVEDAKKKGAKILLGGKREKDFYPPTILTNVSPNCDLYTKEAFGPIVIVETVKDFKAAIQYVNNSVFGLQCGVFTNSIQNMMKAFESIDVGGVLINDTPMFRVDNMPYGGVKDSGFGREGIKYTIDEMTQIKLLVINSN